MNHTKADFLVHQTLEIFVSGGTWIKTILIRITSNFAEGSLQDRMKYGCLLPKKKMKKATYIFLTKWNIGLA
jgi:hypothetical protein